MKCQNRGASNHEEECIELNTIWDNFLTKYEDILDPAILSKTHTHFFEGGRPPYNIKGAMLNDDAQNKVEQFRRSMEKDYKKEWMECYSLEKQVCMVCLLNRQVSLLKKLKIK